MVPPEFRLFESPFVLWKWSDYRGKKSSPESYRTAAHWPVSIDIESIKPRSRTSDTIELGHQLEHRADAHILIAFLAYCLQITLKHRPLPHAPGLTPTAVLHEKLRLELPSQPPPRLTAPKTE
jgi:hypothetical protein